jgi:pilus assembly protein CpaB
MAATWTARESSRSSSTRRTLMISAIFGLISAFVIFRVLSTAQPKSSSSVATVPVVVAGQDIPAKTTITDQMLTVKQVQASVRIPTAYTDTKSIVGHVTRDALTAGEQVLTSKLADAQKDLGFSGQVPSGMRAVSINVEQVVTNDNLIAPGDSVDVIALFQRFGGAPDNQVSLDQEKDDKAKRFTAVTVLQDIQVLAVAQQITDPLTSGSSKPSTSKSGQNDIKTVTLAVTPDDAQRLFLSDQLGTLRLALHRFGEHDVQPLQPLDNTVQQVFGLDAPARPATPPATATPKAGN